eukprot:jgi/Mesvir1/958/Mv17512-RA.1
MALSFRAWTLSTMAGLPRAIPHAGASLCRNLHGRNATMRRIRCERKAFERVRSWTRAPRTLKVNGIATSPGAKKYSRSLTISMANWSSPVVSSAAALEGMPPRDSQIIILGIETSCDETAAAVVRGDGTILGEALASQPQMLAEWGGVVPKLAQGAHEQAIDGVVAEAIAASGVNPRDLSAVAVTIGPGLSLCLRVGVVKAHSIAREYSLPVVPIHHMEAHALVARLSEDVQFPFLTLLISGGHNLLMVAHGVGRYTQLGSTLDDALGEAYDKTARLLGLDMSRGGGPALEALALEGDASRFKFTVPMAGKHNCDFSYAGLKTAVRLAIQEELGDDPPSDANRQVRADIAASFQRVAVAHLENRTKRAIQWARTIEPGLTHLVVAGGVAANKVVRSRLQAMLTSVEEEAAAAAARRAAATLLGAPTRSEAESGQQTTTGSGLPREPCEGLASAEASDLSSGKEAVGVAVTQPPEAGRMHLVCPPPRLCTDNGVMAAWAGVERFMLGMTEPLPEDAEKVDLRPRWPLGVQDVRSTSGARSQKKKRNHTSLTLLTKLMSATEPSVDAPDAPGKAQDAVAN